MDKTTIIEAVVAVIILILLGMVAIMLINVRG